MTGRWECPKCHCVFTDEYMYQKDLWCEWCGGDLYWNPLGEVISIEEYMERLKNAGDRISGFDRSGDSDGIAVPIRSD